MGSNIFEVKNLKCGYDGQEVIKGISFTVEEGDFLIIIGPNGARKTTLFRAMTRIMKPWQGGVIYRDRDISKVRPRDLAKEVAVLPQELTIPFSFTVNEFIEMGRFPHKGRLERLSRNDFEIMHKAMLFTETKALALRRLNEISAGERQRVLIAQGLVQEPKVLFMDEPTSHLDITHQVRLLDLLSQLNRRMGLTVVMILHDLNLASEYAKIIMLIKEGMIYKKGRPQEVLTEASVLDVYDTAAVVIENPISRKPYIFPIPGGRKEK